MKVNKVLLFVLIFSASLLIMHRLYRTSGAFFSDQSSSTGNVFSASAVFPSATPTITPTPTNTPTPTPTSTPTPTPTGVPIAQTLVMNEILPNSTCTLGQSVGQFVELWNGTANTVDLQNFKLKDGSNNILAIANSNTSLASHAFAILAKDSGLINKCNWNLHGASSVNLGPGIDLNTGTLYLTDSSNNVIDTVKWGSGQILQPATDQSVERSPTGLDSATGSNFNASDFVIRSTPAPGL